jgi:hypothetical protein
MYEDKKKKFNKLKDAQKSMKDNLKMTVRSKVTLLKGELDQLKKMQRAETAQLKTQLLFIVEQINIKAGELRVAQTLRQSEANEKMKEKAQLKCEQLLKEKDSFLSKQMNELEETYERQAKALHIRLGEMQDENSKLISQNASTVQKLSILEQSII